MFRLRDVIQSKSLINNKKRNFVILKRHLLCINLIDLLDRKKKI